MTKTKQQILSETKINANQAFENLHLIIKCAKANGKEISNEQIAFCEEWLFDCVHDTGYCRISLPLQIFNDSCECDEFKY